MPRTLVESPITTRASRAVLGKGLHWRGIDRQIHLGYRKGKRGSVWLVRWFAEQDQAYRQVEIGIADDTVSEGTLDFSQAVKVATAAVEKARRKRAADASGPVLTVRLAVETYLAARNARQSEREGREVKSDANSTLSRHVRNDEHFLSIRLDELNEGDLEAWRNALDPTLKGTTKRRIMNDLKAALNATLRRERRRLPSDFGDTILLGLDVEAIGIEPTEVARENQILDNETVRAVINMAFEIDEDFGLLVLVLAATGARFSQLKRMKVCDAQISLRRMLVPRSRKGRNKVAGFTPLRIGEDVLAAVGDAIRGRAPTEPLFCRWRHVQIGPGVWERDRRGAWTSSSEMIRSWTILCEAVGINVVPYALRHSSIVRGIAAGLPVRLVAAMHDTSVAMIERHYSRWIADGLEELGAEAIVPLLSHAA
ncbi:tyrosine-type recombinase/integrase [Sphingomonas sp.]|uniref:tyrosine-type recombinase/integrase n=1 Tax=Sphingomonas sp. TaxID=28214 RepID=UPI003D6D6E31